MDSEILYSLKQEKEEDKLIERISKKGGIFTFLRAQLSSQLASITDFSVTIILATVFKVFLESIFGEYYYGFATGAGAVCGGAVNCFVNYKWTFKAKDVRVRYVVIKYVLVWIGSVFFNTYGTIILTETLKNTAFIQNLLGVYYENIFIIVKVIVSLLVGFIWNYNMQRLFVYRNIDVKGMFKRSNEIEEN